MPFWTNIIVGDVEQLQNLPFNGTADLVVAGDIIEHLSNPGLMLAGLRRFCRPDSLLLLKTPNSFGLPNSVRFVLRRFREGKQHVVTFNQWNIEQLLEHKDSRWWS